MSTLLERDPSLAATHSLAGPIQGWLTEREGQFLSQAACACSANLAIVEIGSWKGKSTVWLGRGSQHGQRAKVYAIDPHTGSPEHQIDGGHVWTFDEFCANIGAAGIEDVVAPIVATSETAAATWQQPIGLLFIDGAHEYADVRRDFDLWTPWLIDGGLLVMHDTTSCFRESLPAWPGPRRVVRESVLGSHCFRAAGIVDSITYATKRHENTPGDRIQMLVLNLSRRLPDVAYLRVWPRLTPRQRQFVRRICRL